MQHSDFSIGLVDIDIRYGTPNWPHLSVEAITKEQITPLASPEFILRHGIETPEDLLQVPLIQSTVSVVQWPQWFASRDVANNLAGFAFKFDRAFMTLDAAVQGLGVALESTFIAEPHLREKRLQPVFKNTAWSMPVQAHFLVCPAHHLQRLEVSNFVHWLQNQAAMDKSS